MTQEPTNSAPPEKDKCKECKGTKVSQKEKILEVDLDRGAPDGKRYTFQGESDEVPGVEPGDVIVEIMVEKHKQFLRKGGDIVYSADISLLESLTGFKLIITHLDGRKILVQNNPGEIIKPGQLKTIRECGMPFFENSHRFGHLYIAFNIVFPDKLDKKSLEIISKVLVDQKPKDSADKFDETYTVTDFKEEEQNTNYSGGQSKQKQDEDDDDMPRGAQRVNCQHQ